MTTTDDRTTPDRVVPDLAAAVHELDSRRARARQRMIGASELGECRRRAAFRVARTKPTNVTTGMAAFLGTAIHKDVLKALVRMYGGHAEVRLQGEQIKGSCDWYCDGVVEDVKTVSKGRFEQIRTRGTPRKFRYQTITYAWLIATGQLATREKRIAGPQDVHTVRIRYICRDNGEDYIDEFPYDPALAAEAIMWLADVYAELEEVGTPELVTRDGFGPGIDSMCDWCPFLDACWGPPIDPEVEGPDATRQARFVDDAGRSAAAADYDRYRAEENAAKRAKDFAKAQLAGWSGTTTTGFTVTWSGGRETAEVDKDSALDRLVDLGETLPTRTKVTARQIRVIRTETADRGQA